MALLIATLIWKPVVGADNHGPKLIANTSPADADLKLLKSGGTWSQAGLPSDTSCLLSWDGFYISATLELSLQTITALVPEWLCEHTS